ncbi:MAG: OmpH family outer membrane protein [Candidatus Binatia bacterium]
MKKIIEFAGAAFLAAFFSIVVFGQTGAPAAGGRIGLINPGMFGDAKAGIVKYRNGAAAVDAAMEPINAQIRVLNSKYQTARTDYENLQKAGNAVNLNAKADELQTIETNMKRIQEDGKAQYDKEYSQIMSPIVNDIIKSLNEYAKQKGYAVILDGAKLEQADILWGFDDRYDVTKDFIVFYNARPAPAAAK